MQALPDIVRNFYENDLGEHPELVSIARQIKSEGKLTDGKQKDYEGKITAIIEREIVHRCSERIARCSSATSNNFDIEWYALDNSCNKTAIPSIEIKQTTSATSFSNDFGTIFKWRKLREDYDTKILYCAVFVDGRIIVKPMLSFVRINYRYGEPILSYREKDGNLRSSIEALFAQPGSDLGRRPVVLHPEDAIALLDETTYRYISRRIIALLRIAKKEMRPRIITDVLRHFAIDKIRYFRNAAEQKLFGG